MTSKKIGEKLDNLENLIKSIQKESSSTSIKKTLLQIGSMIIKLTAAITCVVKLIHLLF